MPNSTPVSQQPSAKSLLYITTFARAYTSPTDEAFARSIAQQVVCPNNEQGTQFS